MELFDRGRRTALHLFEHVHGDSRDRGPAMVDLAQTYDRAGLQLVPGELPDYLPVVLEFASTQPPAQAREFLRETAHIVQAIFSALLERGSPYASVLAAVLDLAGERAQKVDGRRRAGDRRQLGRTRGLRRLHVEGAVAPERRAARPSCPPPPGAAAPGRLRNS